MRFFKLASLVRVVGICYVFLSGAAGAADNDGDPAGITVNDRRQLQLYNQYLDEISTRSGYYRHTILSEDTKFEKISAFSKRYKSIVNENGGVDFPEYSEDTLNLQTLKGYLKYAQTKLKSDGYIPNDQDCGASIEFLYAPLMHATLSDIAPQYSSFFPDAKNIENTHAWGKYYFSVDMPVLEKMCGAPKYERAVTGIKNLMRQLRTDQDVYLARIAPEYKNEIDAYKKEVAKTKSNSNIAAPSTNPVAANEPYPGYSLLTEDDLQRCGLAVRWYFHTAAMRDQGESPDLIYQNLMALTKLPDYGNPPADMKSIIDMVIMAFPGESPAMISDKMMTSCKKVVAKHRIENNPFDWTGMGI